MEGSIMRIRVVFGAVLVFVLAMVLPACDNTPQPTGPTPTAVGPGPGGGSTITYVVSGGIAGVRRELVITPDASATLTDTGSIFGPLPLPQNLRDALKARLDASNFSELQERYGNGSVSDDIVHTLTVSDGLGTKTVTVEELGGKEVTPQAVQELLALMDEIDREVRVLAVITPTVAPDTYVGTIIYTTTRQVDNRNWAMTVTEDGRATITDGGEVLGTVQLESSQLETIRTLLAASDFLNMKIYYGGGEPHPEGFVDTLALEKGGETKRVTMEQGASFTIATPIQRAMFRELRDTLAGARVRLLGTATPNP
jgi:hypothetical protein